MLANAALAHDLTHTACLAYFLFPSSASRRPHISLSTTCHPDILEAFLLAILDPDDPSIVAFLLQEISAAILARVEEGDEGKREMVELGLGANSTRAEARAVVRDQLSREFGDEVEADAERWAGAASLEAVWTDSEGGRRTLAIQTRG